MGVGERGEDGASAYWLEVQTENNFHFLVVLFAYIANPAAATPFFLNFGIDSRKVITFADFIPKKLIIIW